MGGRRNPKTSSGGARYGTGGLGQALVRGRRRRVVEDHATVSETIADIGFKTVGKTLKSVTETNQLEAFISDAVLANRSFVSERNCEVLEARNDDDQSDDGVEHSELVGNKELEVISDDAKGGFDVANVPIPRRPPWKRNMSASQLDENERAAFVIWRRGIARAEAENSNLHVSPFEKNLDFWRQLWRVVERSDVVVQVVDARNPLLFYCKDVSKFAIESGSHKINLLVVNKADFLSLELRKRWAEYLLSSKINFVFFSAKTEIEKLESSRRGEDSDASQISAINPGPENVSSETGGGIAPQEKLVYNTETILTRVGLRSVLEHLAANALANDAADRRDRKATVGMIGYPNVGKSSVINALFGVTKSDHSSQRVSVSATPGHTKHFQTLKMSESTTLCDCPGLVFPTFAKTKADLICHGILPIDEIRGRDFLPAIDLVTRCISRKVLESTYGLRFKLPSLFEQVPGEDFLVAFCEKRGLSAQGHGRLNESFGARLILKDFTSGKLCYCVPPPSADGGKDRIADITDIASEAPGSQSELMPESVDNLTEEELAQMLENELVLFDESVKEDPSKKARKPKKLTKHQRRKRREADPYGNGDYFAVHAKKAGNAKGASSGNAPQSAFTRVTHPYER